MKKSILFTLLLLALLLPANANAYDFKVNGIYYEILSSSDKTVWVTYYSDSNGTVYSNYSGSVTIPASVTYNGTTYSVTAISVYAFINCSGLTSVTIPNSVTNIGPSAFSGCSGLTSVTIGNSVTRISSSAFSGCSSLTSVTIPNSVTTIDDYAFKGCSGLTSVTIGKSVTSIGNFAFSGCNGLTNLVWNARYCSYMGSMLTENIERVTIGNEVEVLPSDFVRGSKITSVIIPNSVTSIGSNAFFRCSGLTSVMVESGNTVYDSREDCNAIIKTSSNELITGCKNTIIPNSVTSIGDYAFYYCSGLTSIIIPNSVIEISSNAFYNCSSLASVTIPNSVTSIGNQAFSYCSGLTSVIIPDSVISIGSNAFIYCSGLNDVYSCIDDPTTISMGSSVFYLTSSNYAERTLHVPAGTLSAYQADTKWSQYFGSIVEMVDTIIATSIELNQTGAELTEGETLQLMVTVLPEDATDKTVTWESSNESVATVDENGLVTAVVPGIATITVTTNDGSNLSASCVVNVLKGIVLAESIQLNVTTVGLNEGATLQLTATVLPEDCDNKTVLWSSNNPSVATVDSNGLVTTHSVGTATITAMTIDGSNLSTTCTVTLLPVGVKGDVNGDNNISIADVTKLIDYLLSGSW